MLYNPVVVVMQGFLKYTLQLLSAAQHPSQPIRLTVRTEDACRPADQQTKPSSLLQQRYMHLPNSALGMFWSRRDVQPSSFDAQTWELCIGMHHM